MNSTNNRFFIGIFLLLFGLALLLKQLFNISMWISLLVMLGVGFLISYFKKTHKNSQLIVGLIFLFWGIYEILSHFNLFANLVQVALLIMAISIVLYIVYFITDKSVFVFPASILLSISIVLIANEYLRLDSAAICALLFSLLGVSFLIIYLLELEKTNHKWALYVMAISWVLALFLWLVSYKVINIDINIDIDTILTNLGPAIVPTILIVLGVIILLKSLKSK
jgi:hypothetical protein